MMLQRPVPLQIDWPMLASGAGCKIGVSEGCPEAALRVVNEA
jgi:hypothetical protein